MDLTKPDAVHSRGYLTTFLFGWLRESQREGKRENIKQAGHGADMGAILTTEES